MKTFSVVQLAAGDIMAYLGNSVKKHLLAILTFLIDSKNK
jgi:hypothetical protein